MERNRETFLTALYVIVDDFYQRHLRSQMPTWGGPSVLMSARAVLGLGLAAPWRSGGPWNSERGLRRSVRTPLRSLLPTVRTPRACHRRLRHLWGACLRIQDAVAEALAHADAYDGMEGFPLPVAHGARPFTPGWLAAIARSGKGGHDRYGSGVRMMLVINPQGGATGWALASGHVQERGGAELLCRTRAGVPGVQGPLAVQTQQPTVTPPTAWMAVWPSWGAVSHKPLLSDCGFRGEDGRAHWAAASSAHVCPLPNAAPGAQRRWWRSARQVVETTLAHLRERCGLTYPGAPTTWGLLRRVAAKVAASNLGMRLNRLFGRPDFACATLIV